MDGYIKHIEKIAERNRNFRQVVETGDLSQIVVMSIPPGGDVGMETHEDTDQVFFIIEGDGKAVLNGKEQAIEEGDAVLVRRGTPHNLLNTDAKEDLKLVTIYSPPHHKPGTIHATRAEADAASAEHATPRK